MFGKPTWFRPKVFGWGLVPISWQGWLYTLSWLGVLLLPFFLLLRREQPMEATIWLAVTIGALVWDTRLILRAMNKKEDDEVFVIDENETESQQFGTRNYDMHIRE